MARGLAGVGALLLTAGHAAAPAPDPLADAAALYGAGLGMTRAQVLSRAPGGCSAEKGDPAQLFLECGARKLSAGFTAAGRAWWVTASYDLTDTPHATAAARAALVARYGRPASVNASLGGATLVWLPAGSAADAAHCVGGVTLLTAMVEQRGPNGGAKGLPAVDAGCLPIRSAILAAHAGHRGIIVQEQDPRARIAELAR